MAVRSTQGQIRAVRSTQGGRGVTLIHVAVLKWFVWERLCKRTQGYHGIVNVINLPQLKDAIYKSVCLGDVRRII